MAMMIRVKGKGKEVRFREPTVLKNKWSWKELGLIGGEDAPVLRELSYGKGPGTDNVLDNCLRRDEWLRNEAFNIVYEVFNNGLEIREQWKEGKIMILSKEKGEVPSFGNHRTITILPTINKLI